MSSQEVYESGRRAAPSILAEGVAPAALADAASVMSRWLSPRHFDESLVSELDPALILVGRPSFTETSGWLETSAGPAPLSTGEQATVAYQLMLLGAYSGFGDLPVELHAEVLHMLDLGMLYALFDDDTECYRGDLVPVPYSLTQQLLNELGRPGDKPGTVIYRNRHQQDVEAAFASHEVAIWRFVDGTRTVDQIIQAALGMYRADPAVWGQLLAALAEEQGASDDESVAAMLRAMFLSGVMAFAQHGFLWLDIRQ